MEYLNQDEIKNICLDNSNCRQENCEKVHLRILEGVCIGYLQNFCSDNNQCGLNHFNYEQLDKCLESQQINGYYQFNLCPKKCSNNSCMYAHPEWLQLVCMECLNSKNCEKVNQKLWHQKWNSLRKEVYKKYHRNGFNPELFCDDYDSCNCSATQQNFDIHCIRYFKGVCPYKRCIKPHVRWENSKEPNQQSQNTIKSCIEYNKDSKYFELRKEQVQQQFLIYFEKNYLISLQKQLELKPQIDILFILDCTKSMDKWLKGVKDNINSIVYEFKQKIPIESSVRIAAVCYKDFDDENHITYHNFTVHSQEIVDFLDNQVASGGEDIPEDLIGALEQAHQLNISKDPSSILLMLIITDAPCHGRKYHNFNIDSKMEEQRLESTLSKFQTKKKLFFLSFIQLSENTLKMEECIRRTISKFQIAKLEPNELSNYISFTLQACLTRSQKMIEDQENNIETVSATFQKLNELPVSFDQKGQQSYLEYIENFIQNNLKVGQTQLLFEKLELQQISKGCESTVYKGFDQRNNQDVILKIPIFFLNALENEKLDEKIINNAESAAHRRFRNQIIAQSLAYQFNKICYEKSLDYVPLYFPSPILYNLSKPFKQQQLIYGEIYIENSQQWKKYSNNLDFSDNSDDLTTFSHFTFNATNQQILVNDLQGPDNILSDPSVQINDASDFYFSLTDHKGDGFQKFFGSQHSQCSQLCYKLGIFLQGCQQRVFAEKLKTQNLRFICLNCNQFQQCEKEQLNIFCSQCKILEKQQTETECKCCRIKFMEKQQFDHLRSTLIKMCNQCTTHKCMKQQELCHYCKRKLCNYKKKYIEQFDDQVPICLQAYNFLRQIKCQKCNMKYKFKQILGKEDYSIGNYQCC